MKNSVAIGIAILIIAGGGYYAYMKHNKKIAEEESTNFTKEAAISYIISNKKASNSVGLGKLEEEYLNQWAKGIYFKKNSFKYNGSEYSTEGGKKIK